MELNPKERFLKSEHAKMFADISANPAFHHALEVALVIMPLDATQTDDPAAKWNQMQGAKTFIKTLLNLAEPVPSTRRAVIRENLQPT